MKPAPQTKPVISAGPDELVLRHVRPGTHLHFSSTSARPNAVLNAVARQFADTRSLTVSVTAVHGNAHALGISGAVRKVITGFLGNTYPKPGPSPLYRNVLDGDPFELEAWSLLTFQQRLLAAATGQQGVLTTSLLGTSLADGKEASLVRTTDPFTGKLAALLSPLRPDLTVVHGVCADRRGNVVICAPRGEGPWAAYAATQGVIASVERIVDDAIIDELPHEVVIPGQRVLGLCEARFGAHPQALPTRGIGGIPGYADDYEFLTDVIESCSSGDGAKRWYSDWISLDHEKYLAALGERRLADLAASRLPVRAVVRNEPVASAKERLVVLGARAVGRRVREVGYDTLLAGIGASHLAAWLAAELLRAEGREVKLAAEIGFYGTRPHAGDVFLFSQRHRSEQLSSITEILGGMVSANPRCLGVLAAAEIDPRGDINTSILPDGRWLTGSGGAHDIAASADCLVVALSGRNRFVPSVATITSPGTRVRTVVNEFGVFVRCASGFRVESHLGVEDVERTLAERTRWQCAADGAFAEPDVTSEELAALRRLDPAGHFR